MTRQKKLLVSLGVLLILFIGGLGKMYLNEQKLHKEMINVVKSEEAKQVFEAGLKNLDANALTEKGIIKSYTIDYESIEHNPMGGIMVTIYINDDKRLSLQTIINKESNGNLKGSGGTYSAELDKKLKEENNEK